MLFEDENSPWLEGWLLENKLGLDDPEEEKKFAEEGGFCYYLGWLYPDCLVSSFGAKRLENLEG